MKPREEIKKTRNLLIEIEGRDGFGGSYYDVKTNKTLNFIFSWGCGFEHLSVSTPSKCPTWEQMCTMKEIFWQDDEVCMQLHPKKSEYVNNHNYCLHIWRPIDKEIPTPPSIMVGLKNNYTEEEAKELMNLISSGACPKW